MDEQLQQVTQSLLVDEFNQGGGQPLLANPTMAASHAEVAMSAVAMQLVRRETELQGVLDAAGWNDIAAYGDSIVARYKERNKSPMLMPKPGMTPEELAAYSMQFEPVRVDPNEIADMRQRLVKLDIAMKGLGTSVWNDPRTMRIAHVLNAEAGPGTPGYAQSEEQSITAQMPFHERALMPIRYGVEAALEVPAQIGVGFASVLQDLGVVSLDGLSLGNAAAHYNGPTSWVQDSDGRWYHNGGKVGAAELYAGVWHSLTGQLIDQEMADYANVAATAQMRQSGIESLGTGVAQFLGSMIPFAGAGGAAMRGGGLVGKGLGWLATGGRSAATLTRAAAITRLMAATAGEAAGLGVYEATTNGRIEGYGSAFLHGATMAVPMMLLGAMGRGTERFLRRTDKIPKRLAKTLAGAAEGMGFAGLDPQTWQLAWELVKDPKPDTWGQLQHIMLVNMVGMAALKGAGAPTPGEAGLGRVMREATMAAKQRRQARQQSAVQAQTPQQAAQTANRSGVHPTTFQAYKEALAAREVAAGKSPAEAAKAHQRVKELEDRLDLEEAGLERTPQEREAAASRVESELAGQRREFTPERPGRPEESPEAIERGTKVLSKMPKEVAGYSLEVKPVDQEVMGWAGSHEWVVRDGDRVIGTGMVRSDGNRIDLLDAEIRPEYQGKGIYSSMLKEFAKLHGGRVASSIAQSSAAKAAWRKAGLEPPPGILMERVEGKEPKPIRALAGVKPSPEKQLVQEGGKEGLEPETYADEDAPTIVAREERRVRQLRDPLEDPRFRELPEAVQEQILSAKDPAQRKEIFNAHVAERRRQVRDPLESEDFRDFPEELKQRILEAPDAEARIAEMLKAPPPKRPGQPAALRMEPHLEDVGVPGTPAIRQHDVLREMEGFEGDPVRPAIRAGVGIRGAGSTKGLLGWFHRFSEIIRLSGARDVVVAAHEWSHAMDMQVGRRRGVGQLSTLVPRHLIPQFFAAADPWYPGFSRLPARSKLAEAWAEFWARKMLGDPELPKDTGTFYSWAMNWIAHPLQAPILEQMVRIESALQQYRDQGAVSRVRSTVVLHDDKKSEQELKAAGVLNPDAPLPEARAAVKKTMGVLHKLFLDDIAGLKASQRKWIEIAHGKEKAAKLMEATPIIDNPTRLYDALRMTASKQAERFLLHATHDLAGRTTGESLKAIFDDIGKDRYEDFITYVVAKRNLEILGKGLATSLHKADYEFTVKKLETPDFIRGAERIKEWSMRLLRYAHEGGLFSDEQFQKIADSYDTYIPFQRVLEGPEQFAPGRGIAERGTGIKELKGSEYEIRDPVNALGDMARNIIAKTHQNMVMKAMWKFSLIHQGVGGFVNEVKRKTIPSNHPLAQVYRALKKTPQLPGADVAMDQIVDLMKQLEKAGAIGDSITLFSEQTIPRGSKPIIAYTPHFTQAELRAIPDRIARSMAAKANHKLMWLEVDVDAFDALMGIDAPQTILDRLPAFMRGAIEGPAKLLRAGATVLSPAFIARNMVRDVVTDLVYTKEKNPAWIFSALGRAIGGAAEVAKGGQAAELFEALGGKGSTYFAGEVAAGRTARELIGLHLGVRGNMRKAYGWIADKLGTSEEFLRVRAFKTARDTALKAGKSELDANLEGLEAGKEITVNFTRGGTVARVLNRLIPYTNAGIQGNRKFLRTVMGYDGKIAQRNAIVRGLVQITVPTVFMWWLNKDKEWYQELPEWRRMNYWNFRLPGMDSVVSLPKPFEVGKMFANLPEAVLDQAFAHDPIGVTSTAWDFMRSLLPSQLLPAILSPAIETAANYDFFTGREIIPDWMAQSRLPHDQQTAYTRWYAKMLSDAFGFAGLDWSPMNIEHLVEGYTGGLVGRVADTGQALTELGGLLRPEGFSPANLPIVGTLLRQQPFAQSRSVQRIFDLDRELTQKSGSGVLTPDEESIRPLVSRAKSEISELKRMAKDGTISRTLADERSFRVAQDLLREVNR